MEIAAASPENTECVVVTTLLQMSNERELYKPKEVPV